MPQQKTALVLLASLLFSLIPAHVNALNMPYKLPHASLQKGANAGHQYVDFSYGTFIPLLTYVGEIARAQALTVTNPALLRFLHAIELVADSADVGASWAVALTNRDDGKEQPNLWTRVFSGVSAYEQTENVKMAYQLTKHAGDLGRFKESLPRSSKKYLRDLRNRRLKEIFGKRIWIAVVARILAWFLMKNIFLENATGSDIVRTSQILFRVLTKIGYKIAKVKHHGHSVEEDLLKRMHRYNRTHKKG